jgi:hypothetical protein
MPKKTTKKVTDSPKVKEKKFNYHIEIESSGVVYKADGNDIYKLLKEFPRPGLFKSETNIKVTKDGKTIQKDLKVFDARRVFAAFDSTSLELLAISIGKMFA